MATDFVVTRVQEAIDGQTVDEAEIGAILDEVHHLESVLGLAMFREQARDVNSEHWPEGMTTNLGELDFQAEMKIREIWGQRGTETQRNLLKRAAKLVRDRITKTEKIRAEKSSLPTLPDPPEPSEAIKG